MAAEEVARTIQEPMIELPDKAKKHGWCSVVEILVNLSLLLQIFHPSSLACLWVHSVSNIVLLQLATSRNVCCNPGDVADLVVPNHRSATVCGENQIAKAFCYDI